MRGRVIYCQMLLDGKFAAGLEKRAEDFKETETGRASKSPSKRRRKYRSVLGRSGKKARLTLRASFRCLRRLCRAGIATGESSSPAGKPHEENGALSCGHRTRGSISFSTLPWTRREKVAFGAGIADGAIGYRAGVARFLSGRGSVPAALRGFAGSGGYGVVDGDDGAINFILDGAIGKNSQ